MKLNRGINLGGYLSQCIHTDEHYATFITEADIKKIAAAGFDHVRVPVDYNVWETENGDARISGYVLTDRLIDWCRKYGLDIILDLHKARGYDFNDANNDSKNNLFTDPALQEKFINLWRTVSARYGHVKEVAFELLNEVVEDKNADSWNSLIARTVKAIRENAPDSTIIYGGIQWNNVQKIQFLEKPLDENIIFTFHFYSPMPFTHQKAEWCTNIDQTLTTYYPDDSLEWNAAFACGMIEDGIAAAAKYGVRIYCGEFGVIDRAPLESTLNWYKDMDSVFRKYNIGCAVWSYKKMSFGIFDECRKPIFNELIKTWMK